MEDINEKKDALKLADRRKAIRNLYTGDQQLRIRLNKQPYGTAAGFFTESSLERIVANITAKSSSVGDIIKLSNYAYATEPNYAAIIDYLSNSYLWRYYYMPVLIKEKSDLKYEETYKMMTDVVDGMAIETIFPIILTKLFKEGVVFLYTVKNTASKTVSTLLLNPEYCSPVMMSQYGTGIYQFDVKYFDSFGVRDEALDTLLELFPDELVAGYNAYKAKPSKETQYVLVDGRYATYIQMNEFNFPSHLNTLRSLFDYNKYRKNEVERNSNQLDQILTHTIPAYEDQLLFELPEVKELHADMARVLSSNSRIRLLTTFGDTEILRMQENGSVENKTLDTAYKAVFQSGGLNVELFSGSSKEALSFSLARDSALVWKFVQQLMNFYNLTINNLFNFKGYQIQLNMIPITHYNMKEQMELYRRNAEYGVGKLELIVASGTKQIHIRPKADVEDFLKLEEILIPLASSHTQKGSPEKIEKKEKEEKTEEKEENDGSEEE